MRFTSHSEIEEKTAAVEERPSIEADVAKIVLEAESKSNGGGS